MVSGCRIERPPCPTGSPAPTLHAPVALPSPPPPRSSAHRHRRAWRGVDDLRRHVHSRVDPGLADANRTSRRTRRWGRGVHKKKDKKSTTAAPIASGKHGFFDAARSLESCFVVAPEIPERAHRAARTGVSLLESADCRLTLKRIGGAGPPIFVRAWMLRRSAVEPSGQGAPVLPGRRISRSQASKSAKRKEDFAHKPPARVTKRAK